MNATLRRTALSLTAFLPLLLITATGMADPPAGYTFLSYDEGLRQAQRDGKKLFVYFGRYGCGFCDKTNKESFSNDDLRKLYTDHYVLVYIDAESGKRMRLPSGEFITEMELGARLKALVTPVFLFLDPDGKTILQVPGFQTAEAFKDFDRYVHQGHYQKQTLNQFLGK